MAKHKGISFSIALIVVLLVCIAVAIAFKFYFMRVKEQVQKVSGSKNMNAFIDMIIKCEGGAYNALFGYPAPGRTFSDFSTHPRVYFPYTDKAGKTVRTSAAGAGQITATTYDALRAKYNLPDDFSPEAQRFMMMLLIGEKAGAIDDVEAGRIEAAIKKVRRIWASLPGSGNNQPERSLAAAKTYYLNAGGTIA